jgi:hypothetical protein
MEDTSSSGLGFSLLTWMMRKDSAIDGTNGINDKVDNVVFLHDFFSSSMMSVI